jgi:hypothetical protein
MFSGWIAASTAAAMIQRKTSCGRPAVTSTAALTGEWAILTVEADDGQAVFRLRTDRPEESAACSFGTSVRIRWPYEGDALGFPEGEDQHWMNQFEDRVESLNWSEGLSYLMLVTTGLNLKEWLFYTTDHQEFMHRFNKALSGLPRLPLEISFITDLDWEQWDSIRRHADEAR